MSHAYVYELSNLPYAGDERMCADDLYDRDHVTMFAAMSDYVTDLNEIERSNAIDELVANSNGGLVRDGDKLTLVSKRKLLTERYNTFIRAVRRATATTEDDFISFNGWFENIFRLEEALVDRTWVRTDDTDIDGLTSFIRPHKDGDVFYIGGVVDYHY